MKTKKEVMVNIIFRWIALWDSEFYHRNKTSEIITSIEKLLGMICFILEQKRCLLLPVIISSDKFVSKCGIKHSQIFNLLLISVIVNLKFWDDEPYLSNSEVSDIFGYNKRDFNNMEKWFLSALGYNLFISKKEIGKYMKEYSSLDSGESIL